MASTTTPKCDQRGTAWTLLQASSRPGFAVECHCPKATTPCCGRTVHADGGTAECPECGWVWAVQAAPTGHVWVSVNSAGDDY